MFYRQQTKKKVTKVDLEKCRARINKCNKGQCSDEADPICGNDAQTYKNQCQLDQATCLYVPILQYTVPIRILKRYIKSRLSADVTVMNRN